MTGAGNPNNQIITEFRENHGRLGGGFAGAPVTLVHHKGRKSGRESVNPVMYLAAESDPSTIYVFATKAGAPTNPDWYYNLTAAGEASVEVGAETYLVSVEEVSGAERERAFDAQVRAYPVFADYVERTAGIRTIPVLALRRQPARPS